MTAPQASTFHPRGELTAPRRAPRRDPLRLLEPRRRGAHDDDAKALALLNERGISEAARKRIHDLVGVVQEGKTPAPEAPAPAPPPASAREAQVKLYGWYSEWAGIAHAVITRRDHLVRLGLATLRRKKKPA